MTSTEKNKNSPIEDSNLLATKWATCPRIHTVE